MRTVVFSRALLYSDASTETGVEFDPLYRLGRDNDDSYVRIEGVGEPTHVRVDHIPQLIEWLQQVSTLDVQYRAQVELTTKAGEILAAQAGESN